MAFLDIQFLVDLFKESIGVEAAEKIVYESLKKANLLSKTFYNEEEFSKICEVLKAKGGFIRTIATIVSTSAFSNIYYKKELARERKEKEDLARLSSILEQKIEERTKELKKAQVQLIQSAKMAAVGQLGAGVAHELNNPLAAILGYAQFILEKLKTPNFGADDFRSCQRYVEIIERETVRSKKIVETLLSFSRKTVSLNPEVLDIRKVIEDALYFTGHQLQLNNIKVITDFKLDFAKVSGISNQLQQVFTNLILNAQEAMPKGGELRIRAENLIDELTPSANNIKIEVADTGCGIAEENFAHIFEPFFSTKTKEKGTGLGLSISYQIIQDHKGTIEVKSRLGKGSTFIITLPVVSK